MAQFLYRLGRWSVARRKLVLAMWGALLVAGVVGAATLAGETSDAFTLPGTESQDAIDHLAKEMPGAGGGSATVVFQASEGTDLMAPDAIAAIAETVERLKTAPQVAHVTDPFEAGSISEDSTIGFSSVAYLLPAAELEEDAKLALEQAPEVARQAGLTVEIGGDVLAETPEQGTAELIGLAAAIIVLLFTFGSLIAAGLPILTALIGVGLGMTGITIATGFTDMSSTAPTLAVMLGLAVGIDYALFIVTRYRQLVATGLDAEESVARAVATAGSAVVFAGATVVIALVALVVVGIPFLTVMGAAAAGTVAIAVFIAITLLPAFLGFTQNSIDRFRVPGTRVHSGLGSDRETMGLRWGRFVTGRALVVLIVALCAVGVFVFPAARIEMGLPDDGSKSTATSERRAYDLLAKGFGPGFNGPLIIAADLTNADDPEVGLVVLEEALKLDNVAAVAPAGASESGQTVIYSVIPMSAPSDPATATLVDDIRAAAKGVRADTGIVAKVTGTAAMNIDITKKLGSALPVYGLVVVGLALVLLTIVFRSILVPIKAALGFLLSVIVSFGATVAVFQWGWLKDVIGLSQPGPIISILPILLLGVLFGLAMDYEVFLVSRIREDYVHSGDARAGIVEGVRHSSRVIMAAGLIMIVVFSAFILSHDPNMKMIGFALAVGVFADAFIVRMTIVPAVLALMGETAWKIPTWLDRLIPNVDIEGAGLTRKLATPEAEPAVAVESVGV